MTEEKIYTAIGMMSGTSLDGIDVALVKTDGKDMTELVDFKTIAYDKNDRQAIRAALGQTESSRVTDKAADIITRKHIEAVETFGHAADIIGFHGQTILHDPSKKRTWQIGDPQIVAQETGIDVVGDMRQADVAAGGQGAPLLPLCHRAFASDVEKPIAILNLGGVGNITYLGKERTDILAFDTGPANALMDDLLMEKTGMSFDLDGSIAARGTPHLDILEKWMTHPYFKRTPPKSLDRDEWDVKEAYNLSLEDGMATLAEFTIKSVLQSLSLLPDKPRMLYVAGGGRHNNFIMKRLTQEASCDVQPVESLGWNGDALEAQGFAYLAVRSLLGLTLTLPSTTGIPEPETGGVLYNSSSAVTKVTAEAN